jgi:hypothetical protein
MEKSSLIKVTDLYLNIVEIEFNKINRSGLKVEFDRNNKISVKAIYYGEEILFVNSLKFEIEGDMTKSFFSNFNNVGLTEIGVKEYFVIQNIDAIEIVRKIAANINKKIIATFIGDTGSHQFILGKADKILINEAFNKHLNYDENKQVIY